MYSKERAILVTGSYDHTLRFWDAYNEQLIRSFEYGTDVNQFFEKLNWL